MVLDPGNSRRDWRPVCTPELHHVVGVGFEDHVLREEALNVADTPRCVQVADAASITGSDMQPAPPRGVVRVVEGAAR